MQKAHMLWNSAFPPTLLLRQFVATASLNTKLMLSLIAVALIAFFGMLVALSATIVPSFDALEQREANLHIERTETNLDEFAKGVETAARDYGAWDDSFAAIVNPSKQFEQGTFSLLAFSNLDISGMAYVRFDGKIVYSRWYDLENEVEVVTQARELERLLTSPVLLKLAEKQDSSRFYARLGSTLAAVSVARVVKTDGSGTPMGFVAMARTLDTKQLKDLLKLDAHLDISTDVGPVTLPSNSEYRLMSVEIKGIDGKAVAHANFKVPRTLSAMGMRTLLIAFLASVAVLTLVLVSLRRLVKALALDSLRDMEQHMQRVSREGVVTPYSAQERHDEIGSLVRSFNQMLIQLNDLRERVEIQSFKLGKTESAVSLMHNVRNGLNPVSVILSQAAAAAPPVASDMIGKALSELGNAETSNARREKLVAFVAATHTTYAAALSDHRSELLAARTHLLRVVEMISGQQAAAHDAIDTTECDISSVIEQNAALARYSATGTVRFSVSAAKPLAIANKILLSQVIGNLFANAIESIQNAQRKNGVVEVSFESEIDAHGATTLIIVRDNGEGFEPQRAQQLFEKGFSTRREKAGGLGLHWCAHALGMMSGSLSLESAGSGLGATAIVRLRAARPVELIEDRAAQAPDCDNAPGVIRREIRNHQ